MSQSNYIPILLNIKDKNVNFSDYSCKIVKIKEVDTMVITALLCNKPSSCPNCGGKTINIHGYKCSNIKIPSISCHNAILKLKKQRYKCKCCGKTFTAETSVVDKNCQISNNTKQAALIKATDKISEKDIAKEFNISHNTVNRLINSFKDSYKVNLNYLPKVLCFDEFKSTNDIDGSMSFIFADADTHRIIDIVEDRRLYSLEKYFMRFSKKARESVKKVVMDMYSPYISLVKKCFKNAKIIFDRFHIVNSLSRALNKTRIKFMNSNKELYNKFKNYWKLLLKQSSELDCVHHYKSRCFGGKYLTHKEIVEKLLSYNDELKNTYEIYQQYLYLLKTNNTKTLENLIDMPPKNISSYMATSLKTLKLNKEYILNATIYKYNNGLIEGINNKIKTIKRIAFGYRSFYHFRNRILIMSHLISIN